MLGVEHASLSTLIEGKNPFERMRKRIDDLRDRMDRFFARAAHEDWLVAGYGAPAKLTTLSHELGLSAADIAYVVDDSPWKQGLLTPGLRYPVVPSSQLAKDPPDRLVLFAWNFADQIIAKHPNHKFVVPLPAYREV